MSRQKAAPGAGPKKPGEYWLDRLMRLRAAGGPDAPAVIYQLAHGSRLYGLSTPESDVDLWQIWENLPEEMSGNRHQEGRIDIMVLSWNHFAELANAGSAQALEAMFAPRQPVDRHFALRQGFRPNTAKSINTYQRAITKFAEDPLPKVRRHSARLQHDLNYLTFHGRFDPEAFSRTNEAALDLYAS